MSNQLATTTPAPPRSVLVDMATRYGMEAKNFQSVVMATCMPAGSKHVSNEEFAAFLMVARDYNLNPFTKQIYAFPTRSGGIQPIVSVDGWIHLVNSHPDFNGVEFDYHMDAKDELNAIECKMYRKSFARPICVTEWMVECKRSTDPWKSHGRRMLRHKAYIQAARFAFGFGGITDEEDYDAIDKNKASAQPMPSRAEIAAQTKKPSPEKTETLHDIDGLIFDDGGLPAHMRDELDGDEPEQNALTTMISAIQSAQTADEVQSIWKKNAAFIATLGLNESGALEVAYDVRLDELKGDK